MTVEDSSWHRRDSKAMAVVVREWGACLPWKAPSLTFVFVELGLEITHRG